MIAPGLFTHAYFIESTKFYLEIVRLRMRIFQIYLWVCRRWLPLLLGFFGGGRMHERAPINNSLTINPVKGPLE
jgi:hypothetical protein